MTFLYLPLKITVIKSGIERLSSLVINLAKYKKG